MIARPQRTLLIVDDDTALRQMLGWSFEDLGYLVRTAGDCHEAMDSTEVLAFDCALIDHHLPDGEGSLLAYWLRRRMPELKLVMMSADPGDAEPAADRIGVVSHFMSKPLHLQRLLGWFDESRPI